MHATGDLRICTTRPLRCDTRVMPEGEWRFLKARTGLISLLIPAFRGLSHKPTDLVEVLGPARPRNEIAACSLQCRNRHRNDLNLVSILFYGRLPL
jgi:hypothetical protein